MINTKENKQRCEISRDHHLKLIHSTKLHLVTSKSFSISSYPHKKSAIAQIESMSSQRHSRTLGRFHNVSIEKSAEVLGG